MDIAYWFPIIMQVVTVAAVGGVLYEKVRQLEHRLNGNGNSVPGRCQVHSTRLDDIERRLTATEE